MVLAVGVGTAAAIIDVGDPAVKITGCEDHQIFMGPKLMEWWKK